MLFRSTQEGCKKGADCPFVHPRRATPSKSNPTKKKKKKGWCKLCEVEVTEGAREVHEQGKKHRQLVFEKETQQRNQQRLDDEKSERAIAELRKRKIKLQNRKRNAQAEIVKARTQRARTQAKERIIKQDTERRLQEDRLKEDEITECARRRKFIASICSRSRDDGETDLDSYDPFQQIPDEILLHLFSLLSYRDLCALSLVNSRWLRIMHDSNLWRYIIIPPP